MLCGPGNRPSPASTVMVCNLPTLQHGRKPTSILATRAMNALGRLNGLRAGCRHLQSQARCWQLDPFAGACQHPMVANALDPVGRMCNRKRRTNSVPGNRSRRLAPLSLARTENATSRSLTARMRSLLCPAPHKPSPHAGECGGVRANPKLSRLQPLCRPPSEPGNRPSNPHAHYVLALLRWRSHKLAAWLNSASATTPRWPGMGEQVFTRLR